MPHAIIVELQSLTGKSHPSLRHTSPGDQTRHAHGLLFRLLKQADNHLATALHNAPRKPFTLYARSHGDDTVSLRIAFLQDDLWRPVLQELLREAGNIPLGEQVFKIRKVITSSSEDPRVGSSPWSEFLTTLDHSTDDCIQLHFQSPTVFRTSKPGARQRLTPLPEPRLIFQSLVAAWQAHSPKPLSQDQCDAVLDSVDMDVSVKRLDNIRTSSYAIGNARMIGFTGKVTLHVMVRDDTTRSMIHQLARFAFFSGIGTKTALGMGQVGVRINSSKASRTMNSTFGSMRGMS